MTTDTQISARVDDAHPLPPFEPARVGSRTGTDLAAALSLAYGLFPADALRLCAQCHGPQYRDYRHGAHGGMRGHWDLSRGPRERNHCVACHDPHAPAFGQFEPVPGPRDRFTGAAAPHGDAHD